MTFLPNSTFPLRVSENVDFRFVNEANKYPTNNIFYFVVYNDFQQQMYPVLGSYELIHAPKVIYLYNNRLESLTLCYFSPRGSRLKSQKGCWMDIGRKEEEEEEAWDHLHLFIIKVWIWKITVKFNGACNIEFGACNFDKAK